MTLVLEAVLILEYIVTDVLDAIGVGPEELAGA